MEAGATAHHGARELNKLGHEVRLMPPRYVKPYVKRNKNDAADAEAICEAVTRPTMRFVPVKTVDQQSVLMLHRTRQLFIRQRTTLINSIRAHLAEFGIVAGIGRNGVEALLEVIDRGEEEGVPPEARVYGQRPSSSAASKGRTHGSSDQRQCIRSKSSCQHGAVHTWPKAVAAPS
jgi:transposase